MMPRDEWEQERAERVVAEVRRRRSALEDFAGGVAEILAAAPSDEARAAMEAAASRLADLLRDFHMNHLDEMERLRAEIETLARP